MKGQVKHMSEPWTEYQLQFPTFTQDERRNPLLDVFIFETSNTLEQNIDDQNAWIL